MDLQILGPTELLSDDGEPLNAGPLKQRVVLALLGLEPNRVVSVERLIDGIWGDEPPPSALATLRGLVSALRRTIGATRVEWDPAGYRLRADRAEVDACRFEDMARNGDDLEAALSCWRGTALDGLGHSLVIDAERQRLDSMRWSVVERWADMATAEGRDVDVIDALEHELIRARWRESMWVRLMLALYRSNRQADALAACSRARRWLADDFGLNPGPEMCELERRILVHDPTLVREAVPRARAMRDAPTSDTSIAGGVDRGASPTASRRADRTIAIPLVFAGRAGELTHLRQRLPNRSGSVAMVVGEPGIGKTRLLSKLTMEAGESGVTVLWGRSPDGDWAAPYSPFVEGIERHLSTLHPDAARRLIGTSAEPLVDLLSIIRPLCPEVVQTRVGDAVDLRFEIFNGFSRLLTAIATTAPVLIVLDDLHWADRATLALLSFLAPLTAVSPISILGTYRDTEVGEMHPLSVCLGSMQQPVSVERVRLRGLSAAAARELVIALGDDAPSDERVDDLVRSSGGNPLYLTELVRSGHGTHGAVVPEGVISTIQLRLARLSANTRSMLRIGALFDEHFPLDAARVVADLSEDAALDAIDEAIGAHLIEPAELLDEYRFVHALTRVAAQATINPSRLPRLHRRIATTLDTRPAATSPTTMARVATHFHASRGLSGTEAGITAALAAADHADQVAAHAQRATFLRMASEMMSSDDVRLPQALAQLALAFAISHQPAEAAEIALVAVEQLARSEGSSAACQFLCELFGEFRTAYDRPVREVVMKLFETGISIGRSERPLGWMRLSLMHHIARLDAVEDVDYRERAELLDDAEFRALGRLALDADADWIELAALRSDLRSREEAARVRQRHPIDLAEQIGDYRLVVANESATIERLQHRRQTSAAVLAHCHIAGAYAVLGDLDAGRQHLVAAEHARAATVPDVRHWNNLSIADFLLTSVSDGPWDEYVERSATMWNSSLETAAWLSSKEQWSVPWQPGPLAISIVANVHARRGRDSRAVEALGRMLPYLSEGSMSEYRHARIHHNAAEVIWFTGDTTHLEMVEAAARQRWLPLVLSNFGADVRLSLARLCAIDGRIDEATDWFDAARKVFAAQGALPLLAITDHDEAWMHLRHPGHTQTNNVVALLDRATGSCREIGMPGWLARCSAMRAQLGSVIPG